MKRILCIWLPNWPIQRLVAAQPELKSRPILLHYRDPRRGLRIAACSSAARRLGVRRDMPLTEAAALVEREAAADDNTGRNNTGRNNTGNNNTGNNNTGNSATADLRGPILIEPHRPRADQERLAELAIWCQQFSPLVGWETVASKQLLKKNSPPELAGLGRSPSCDFLFLDVAGLGPLFESESRLARLVAEAFRRRDLYASVAVATCPGAAWALSRYGEFPAVRRGASGLPRQRAWFADEEQLELERAPLESLRVPQSMVETLRGLGVQRIAQLEQLPRQGLLSRFGPQLLLRLEQLRGQAPETLAPHQPPDKFQAVWLCDPPTSRLDNIEEAVRQLIQQVAKQLDACDRGAMRLQCVIHHQPGLQRQAGSESQLQVELFQPTCNAVHLFELMRMQLERFRLAAAAAKIEVNAVISAPLDVQQAELFGDGKRSRTRQFSMLLNRLNARLGDQRVLRPRLTADPQPERACQLDPVGGNGLGGIDLGGRTAGRSGKRRGKSKSAGRQASASRPTSNDATGAARKSPRGRGIRVHIAAHRPLQLYSPPREIETSAVVPDGPPIRFRNEQQLHRVLRHWGPERIETGWWRGPSVRRDYYRVETEDGGRYWLFRELSDCRWFLHGAFS